MKTVSQNWLKTKILPIVLSFGIEQKKFLTA